MNGLFQHPDMNVLKQQIRSMMFVPSVISNGLVMLEMLLEVKALIPQPYTFKTIGYSR